MTGLLFENPSWLAPLCAVVSASVVALGWAALRGLRRLRLVMGPGVPTAPWRRGGPTRLVGDLALAAALVLVAVAFLGPRIGRETILLSTSGVDLVVLLDASRSMDARDTPPSRIDAARRVALELLDRLEAGDRAALAVFGGRGVLLTPLTPDHAALRELATAIETSVVRPGGSNLPSGIDASLAAFERASDRPRAILVLSDGEALEHSSSVSAVAALRANTRIFAAAFGSEEGDVVPDHGVPLRDARGSVVTTRRRAATLESLARRTDGRAWVADAWGRVDLDALVREIRAPVARAAGEFAPQRVTVPVVVPFAGAALALLCADALAQWWLAVPRPRRRARRLSVAVHRRGGSRDVPRRGGLAVALVSLIALLAADVGETGRRIDPPEPEALLQSGIERARAEDWRAAERHLLGAALRTPDPALASAAYHNLGVVALEQSRLEEARDHFFDALAVAPRSPTADPARAEARARTSFNLAWTLDRLERTPKKPRPGEGEPRSQTPEPGSPPEKRDPPDAPSEGAGKAGPEQAASAPGTGTPKPGRGERRASARAEPAAEAQRPPIDDAERERWLARVRDDPRKALLSASFDGSGSQRERRAGRPTW